MRVFRGLLPARAARTGFEPADAGSAGASLLDSLPVPPTVGGLSALTEGCVSNLGKSLLMSVRYRNRIYIKKTFLYVHFYKILW